MRKGWERSGDAARSWELFEEDLKCLKALHANAYRFSVEWSRLEPEPGRFDEDALARYASWARRLKEEGIRPIVCFHHFSEPAWLLQAHPRGWLDEAVVERYLSFVERAAAVLKEHVSDWLTFNEPMVFLVGAYGAGQFPPGRHMLFAVQKEFIPVLVPNLARAHNEAYDILHRLQAGARVSLAQHISALEPARAGDEDAVRRWDWFMHRHLLDLTHEKLDFLGINYYTQIFVGGLALPWAPMGVLPGFAEIEQKLTPWVFKLLGGRRGDRLRTGMGWEIVPEGLERVVLRFWEAYRKPIVITENGVADEDGADREAYIKDHLTALSRAMEQGADVRGYLHWSLTDNYEWGSYKPRFGLFSRQRKPSAGARFFGETARTGTL